MDRTSTNKTPQRISFIIYFLAGLGLASIIFEPAIQQPLRFQYRNISPNGVCRAIADYFELIALFVLMLRTVKENRVHSLLVSFARITYTVLIIIDINSWLSLSNDPFYIFIIVMEALPLVMIAYELHIFAKEFKSAIIIGALMTVCGIAIWQLYYANAIAEKYSVSFYEYPFMLRLTSWLSFAGIYFIISGIMEAIRHRQLLKNPSITLDISNEVSVDKHQV